MTFHGNWSTSNTFDVRFQVHSIPEIRRQRIEMYSISRGISHFISFKNEYVQMPKVTNTKDNNAGNNADNIVYDVVGVGGGRVPGSAPAQQSNKPQQQQQSHYASVKTDEMGFPVTR